jgi:hypothetical protein
VDVLEGFEVDEAFHVVWQLHDELEGAGRIWYA